MPRQRGEEASRGAHLAGPAALPDASGRELVTAKDFSLSAPLVCCQTGASQSTPLP